MSCPFCGSLDNTAVYKLTGYDVLRCSSCRLLFNSHYPPRQANYDQEYYHGVQSNAFRFHGENCQRDPSAKIYSDWLERLVPVIKKGKVLDVGCGLGTFLAVAKSRGWDAQGTDVSQYAAESVRKNLGIEVFCGSLINGNWPSESFDLITFWDSIEHVANPREYLARARELLKPEGRVIISTDNADCLIGNLAIWLYRVTNGRFKYAMERFFIPHNAAYFTARQFRDLVEDLGFAVLEFRKMEYPLAKINANILERIILGGFYALAKLFRGQAQFTMLLRRK